MRVEFVGDPVKQDADVKTVGRSPGGDAARSLAVSVLIKRGRTVPLRSGFW